MYSLAKAEPPNSYPSKSVLRSTAEVQIKTGTHGEGTRGISGSRPAPATVQTETLITNNLDDSTALESLGVCLTLDL